MAGRNPENAEARAARLAAKLAAVEELLDQHQRTVLEQARRLEEEQLRLRESEERFRTIYEGSNDAIMLLTEKGFFDCNPCTLQMFGFKSKEEFIRIHPADVSPPAQPGGQASLAAVSVAHDMTDPRST